MAGTPLACGVSDRITTAMPQQFGKRVLRESLLLLGLDDVGDPLEKHFWPGHVPHLDSDRSPYTPAGTAANRPKRLERTRRADAARAYLIGGGVVYAILWLYGLVIDPDMAIVMIASGLVFGRAATATSGIGTGAPGTIE